jgi:hypothetical protein
MPLAVTSFPDEALFTDNTKEIDTGIPNEAALNGNMPLVVTDFPDEAPFAGNHKVKEI